LTEISDFTIIMEDPLVIQPSSLELVTLKKRENDVGFLLMNSMNSGIQRITDIKFNSPAYHSGKIEDGDEIVQVNYQTVVGWNDKRVIALLNDSPPDVLMTLKTKPKHNKMYGQIYIKPYRLPSKKRSLGYRWGDLPSPRASDFFPSTDVPLKKVVSDSESSSSEIMTPTDDKPLDKEMRLYMPKPRAKLQRRHSISGDQYNSFKSSSSNWFFNEAKNYSNNNDSPSLRDKSVSFGFGLELTPRPTTCLGIGANNGAAGHSNNGDGVLNGSLPEMMTSEKKMSAEKKPGISKVVRFESTVKLEEQHVDTKYTCNVDNTVLETFEPIPYVDEEEKVLEPEPVAVVEAPQVEAASVVVINREVVRRGKLDKSFSTPAYGSDNDSGESTPLDC
jgi:connector enhancer of kinase suppressor of Ras 2